MSKQIEIPIPRIRTGYYANLKAYKESGYTLVSISRTMPKLEEDIKVLSLLAPSQQLLNRRKSGEYNWVDYEYHYRKEIESAKITPEFIIQILSSLVFLEQTNGIVLLCYEKDHMKCHRSILADILNQSGVLDEAVEEFHKNE